MPIVHAAVVPHPPILIPNIGQDNLSRLKQTVQGYKKLAEKLKSEHTETIVMISPHGIVQSGAFTLNQSPEYHLNYEEFGDLVTKRSWPGNIGLAHRIRESMETTANLQMVSVETLDHGTSVPLFVLTEDLPDIKVIPLYYSGLDYQAHFKFGELLRRELIKNSDRVAVIASGDLSHRLTKDAPAGFSPRGKKFDKKIVDLLKKKKTLGFMEMDRDLVIDAGECGLKSIMILAGILNSMSYEPRQLSYEAPFGVGYLVMDFNF